MLTELQVPVLMIRGTDSDMLAADAFEKARQCNPRLVGVEVQASHDVAGDNPDALVATVSSFLADAGI